MELLQRHDLEDVEPTSSLARRRRRSQDAQSPSKHQSTALLWMLVDKSFTSKQLVILSGQQQLVRPDLSFEVHLLTQSLTAPTRGQEQQLHRVLRYHQRNFALHLELASSKQENRGEGSELGTSGFLSFILDRSMQTNKHSLLDSCGEFL